MAFKGFPRRVHSVPVPSPVFGPLLEEISDVGELKCTLRIIWLLQQKKGYPRYVTLRELLADRVLVKALASSASADHAKIKRALAQAVRRGTFATASMGAGEAQEHLFVLNTEADKNALTELVGKEVNAPNAEPWRGAVEKPNIFSLYEANVGMLSPLIADELREAEELYPNDWIEEAFREAVTQTSEAGDISRAFWSVGTEKVEQMENLGDILKRLDATKRENGEEANGQHLETSVEPEQEVCRICGGRRWYTPEVPAGHPDFGRIVTCDCQKERISDERFSRLLRYSNLGHLSRFTFDTLDPKGRSNDAESQELFQEAYQAALEFSENPSGWLIFVGPNGTGKTHLAAAIANQCIQKGEVVFFVHVPDLLDHMRSTYAPTSEISYSELLEQVIETPLLILDGLGTHSSTPWAQEKLNQIINHRYNAQLPTIVTTAADIEQLDPYVRSRFLSTDISRVVEVRSHQPAQVHRLGRIDGELLRRMTFDTFDVRGNNPSDGQRRSLEAAFYFAKNYAADPDGWLTIFGETGVGKTHLAVAIANERLRKGQSVFFAFVPELLDYLRYTFTPESRVTYDRIFDEVKNTALLILDDLGQEQSSPWADEKLYQIIVHRHNSRLPTVITTMLDFSEQNGPIGSRIQDPSVGQLIRIDSPDYRIKGSRPSRDNPRRASR